MGKHKKKKGEPTSEKPQLGTVVERNKDHIVVEHRWREKIPIASSASGNGVGKVEDDPETENVLEDIENEETHDASDDDSDYVSNEETEEVDEEE